ncbi:MAG: LysM peptidoglycan-binding domain-containing protein [Candidatus Latescibacterota bacterium]
MGLPLTNHQRDCRVPKTTWFRRLNVLFVTSVLVAGLAGCTGGFRSESVQKARVASPSSESETARARARETLFRAQEAYRNGDLEEAKRAIRFSCEGLTEMGSDDPETAALLRSSEQWRQKILAAQEEAEAENPISAMLEQLEAEAEVPSPPSEEQIISEIVAGCDLPIDPNHRVRQGIQYFRTTGRKVFRIWLERSGRYFPMIRKIFEEEGVPLDLCHLAMVESGLNPLARSWAEARGLWQFIGSTGRMYTLGQTWWLDERLDPVKSTRAAARYLKDLHREFGDWRLAVAAYNCGPGRVRQAIRLGKTEDVWQLRLPKETDSYVPSFMAAVILSKRPEVFGFADVVYETPMAFDEVTLDACTDLRVVARCVSNSYEAARTFETLKFLNPELLRWCTPPRVPGYRLNLPKGTAALFLSQYALVPDSEKIEWQRHRVRKGEALTQIARAYHIPMRSIMEANNLKNPNRLKAGAVLIIPLPQVAGVSLTDHAAQSSAKGNGRRVRYAVRKGDTLSQIAAAHRVGVSALRRWNDLRGSLIRTGQVLIIWQPEEQEPMLAALGAKDRQPLRGQSATVRAKTVEERSSDASERIHVVRRGDTLSAIARHYGTSVKDLRQRNALGKSLIRPGERLTISR